MTDGHDPRANLRLRRVDWRVLLHGAAAGAVVTDDAELAACLGLASGLTPSPGPLPAGEPVALVALAHPTRRRVAAAARRTGPDGVVYAEATTPRARAALAPRHLAAQGLTHVARWWVWPRPAVRSPRRWVPADADVGADVMRHLGDDARRVAAWRAAARLGATLPLGVLAGRKEPPLTATLRRHLPTGVRDAPLSWVLITGGHSPLNKVTALAWVPGRGPVAVVKSGRIAEARRSLTVEARALAALEGVPGVPHLVFHDPVGGVVAEQYVAGTPLLDALAGDGRDAALRDGCAWLAGLAARTRRPADVAVGAVAGIMARYRDAVVAGSLPAAVAPAATSLVAALPTMPGVAEHRDCSPWNLVRTPDGRIAAWDWESATVDGVPGTDIVYLLTYANLHLRRAIARPEGLLRWAWDAATPHGADAAARRDAYLAGLGVAADAAPGLMVLTWMIHATAAAERAQRGAGDGGHAVATLSALLDEATRMAAE